MVESKDLRRLRLSREVGWYLESRGIDLPTCPPKFKTPEPSRVAGARFDPERVDRVLKAFSLLVHTGTHFAGQPLVPDSWEVAYIIAPVFGWVRKADETELWAAKDRAAGRGNERWLRVISTLYVEVPRRNGKTTLAGAIALYLTCSDGEAGAQVVTAATQFRQAQFVFDPIRQLAQRSPNLKPHVQTKADRIIHPSSGSYVEVVSSAADAQHGANLHGAIVDELHLHKTPGLVEAIETGTGSRLQPLTMFITTADDGRTDTIYNRKRDRIERLCSRTIKDETTYGVIWAADERDDPYAEKTWRKANPGYGVSPTRTYLRKAATEAQQSPAALANFLRMHLGIRTKQDVRFIDLPVWDRNAGMVDEADLAGREAYGGLDLAATYDLCALAWDFPDDDGGHDVLWRFWTPEANLRRLNDRTAGLARTWVDEGWLKLTPGEVTDYSFIRASINADREVFDVRELAYDPWNATQIVSDLQADEAPMAKMQQGFVSLSPPTKQLLHLLLEGKAERPRYRHGGNPVMRWMVDNLAVEMDAAGNVKPSKKKSAEKIDGVSAAVMALDRAINRPERRVSAYESRGVEII